VKFTIPALPTIQRIFHTLGMNPVQRIMGFLWLDSFVVALKRAANSIRRWNAIMETYPTEILPLRPPVPGHGHTQAGPPSPSGTARSEAQPGWAARPRQGSPRAGPRQSRDCHVISDRVIGSIAYNVSR